jgi:hypothetical protein
MQSGQLRAEFPMLSDFLRAVHEMKKHDLLQVAPGGTLEALLKDIESGQTEKSVE